MSVEVTYEFNNITTYSTLLLPLVSDVAKDFFLFFFFFLVSHFHKFHQKWSVILGYFSHEKNKMLSVIFEKRSVYDRMTDTNYISALGSCCPIYIYDRNKYFIGLCCFLL